MPEREFQCGFCLGVVSRDDPMDYPTECPYCHLGRCSKCGTWLRHEWKQVCYGCGELEPVVEAAFLGTDTFASVYQDEAWMRRNISESSDGVYRIAVTKDRRELRKYVGHELNSDFEVVRTWEKDEIERDKSAKKA